MLTCTRGTGLTLSGRPVASGSFVVPVVSPPPRPKTPQPTVEEKEDGDYKRYW